MTEVILINGLDTMLRRSHRRRTIGLSVTAEGKLVVCAPWGMSEERIAQVVEKKRTWVERTIAKRREALALLPDGAAFFLGKPYRLMVVLDSKEVVEFREGGIWVGVREELDGWVVLRSWYQREAERVLSERVRHYAEKLRLKVEQVKVREWKSRWGECRPDGVLRFNWRVVLLPSEVLEYVVVHELMHLLEPSHKPRFWRFMATALPEYASQESWLKRYGMPFLHWRPASGMSLQGVTSLSPCS